MRRLFILGFIWGWSFLFIKVAVAGMSPPTVACIRVGLGAAVLLTWLRWRGVPLPRDRALWKRFALVGLFGSALPFTMLAWGEERISSALTAVVNASTPMFTALAAAALLHERLKRAQIAGLVVGIVGVGVAAGLGAADLTGSSIAGVVASTAAGACYGLAFAWMKRDLVGLPPPVAAAGQLLSATVLLAPFAIGTSLQQGISLSPTRIAALLLLGIVGTGVAYLFNYRIVADLGATKASLVTYVIPAVAVALGVVVLDEPFSLRIPIGGVLIALGIAAVNNRLRPTRVPSVIAVVLLALFVVPFAGCGDAATGASDCADARRETFDPSSAQHLIEGGPEPEYQTDPPTSGPHVSGPPLAGVLDTALSRPRQVGQLEAGVVLLQHRDLPADELVQLETLAGDGVVVVPNPELADPVVATAWLFKQTCSAVDAGALERFVAEHGGQGPGPDG